MVCTSAAAVGCWVSCEIIVTCTHTCICVCVYTHLHAHSLIHTYTPECPHMPAFIHACTCTQLHAHIPAHTHTTACRHTYTHTHTKTHTHMTVCTHTCAHTQTHTQLYAYIPAHPYTSAYTHTYTHTTACIHICAHIPAYEHIHAHIHTPSYTSSIQPCHLGEAVVGRNTAVLIQRLSREKCFPPQVYSLQKTGSKLWTSQCFQTNSENGRAARTEGTLWTPSLKGRKASVFRLLFGLPVAVIKHPDKSNLREKGFMLFHSQHGEDIMVAGAMAAGHTVSAVRKHREVTECWVSALSLSRHI